MRVPGGILNRCRKNITKSAKVKCKLHALCDVAIYAAVSKSSNFCC